MRLAPARRRLLHEGSLVTKGLKRIVRSDVLYTLPGRPAADPDEEGDTATCEEPPASLS